MGSGMVSATVKTSHEVLPFSLEPLIVEYVGNFPDGQAGDRDLTRSGPVSVSSSGHDLTSDNRSPWQ